MERLLEATHRAERRHFWFQGFRRFVRPLLSAATVGVSNPLILDCGCGTGSNLEMLMKFGRPFGFDLAWLGVKYAREYGQTRVVRASVTHIPFPGNRFDVVTSFDVLYTLTEPDEKAAIAEMFRVLRPGGAAIVNAAALDVLRGNHSVLSEEVRRYTRRRLRAALEGAGFHIVRLTYTNATLFPLMLAVRTAQRLVGLAPIEDSDREITLPPAPVNAILSALLALEARALALVDMPVGSSLLCLARKPAGR